ncbi:uncharacterized protein METZ01_LOCUS269118 [marine metagenome]|uniref:Uncharacterized protein n=1 Tax=marine metagenome TaxID=408172 RepID=A0A382JUU7_9ZZZZ
MQALFINYIFLSTKSFQYSQAASEEFFRVDGVEDVE